MWAEETVVGVSERFVFFISSPLDALRSGDNNVIHHSSQREEARSTVWLVILPGEDRSRRYGLRRIESRVSILSQQNPVMLLPKL
jgi:hypothetical protein